MLNLAAPIFKINTIFTFVLGDEVIEWNGRSFRQKNYQDVHDIIAESKQEPHVELIVLRRIQPEKSIRHPYSHQRRGRNQGIIVVFNLQK